MTIAFESSISINCLGQLRCVGALESSERSNDPVPLVRIKESVVKDLAESAYGPPATDFAGVKSLQSFAPM